MCLMCSYHFIRERERERETDRQRERQTDRQTDRQRIVIKHYKYSRLNCKILTLEKSHRQTVGNKKELKYCIGM